MEASMSLRARRELLNSIRERYRQAAKQTKTKILDEFMESTGYGRKHAVALLNRDKDQTQRPRGKGRRREYGEDIKQILVRLWRIANEICSKRLIPFLPDLIEALERTGRLQLTDEVRTKLLKICPATADKLLASERKFYGRGLTTTRSGKLLKRQISVRTFADWNDVEPGFFEADLVAHCGDTITGSFLNSLVLTDIATAWTECFALLNKCELEVLAALKQAQRVLPIPLLGFDSDNGSEFINHGLQDFCEAERITFTRSRPYKKNDQCFVEQKNGSVVRRIVGYDRYEGQQAKESLQNLHDVMHSYVNFFQPSMKLISKHREGSKTSRKYDVAQTPYRRMLSSSSVSEGTKLRLQSVFMELDPVLLMDQLEQLQDALWKHAGKRSSTPAIKAIPQLVEEAAAPQQRKFGTQVLVLEPPASVQVATASVQATQAQPVRRQYRKITKPRKPHPPHTWRNRKDPLEDVSGWLRIRVLENPKLKIGKLLKELQRDYPGRYSEKHKRTLARRMKEWRAESRVHSPEKWAERADSYDTAELQERTANNGQKLRKNGQPRKPHPPHTWRTRKDPFEEVSDQLRLQVIQNPRLSVVKLLKDLEREHPGKYSNKMTRTLRRRLKEWRATSSSRAKP
jgi:hypothetical protein